MKREYLYAGALGLVAAVVAYLHCQSTASAAPAGAPAATGGGSVTGGDPTIISGTFGYSVPASIPAN